MTDEKLFYFIYIFSFIKGCLSFLDMGRCAITKGRQALELRSNLSERRSLTDQIQTSDCSASYSARNLQWAVAHGNLLKNLKKVAYFIWGWVFISLTLYFFVFLIPTPPFTVLPESRCLQFDCGVKVQLGFAAEFSNVMVIYTRILKKPNEIVSCSAQLTDFPVVCYLLSNGCLLHVDFDLLNSHRSSWICFLSN